ncbi:MAG: flagellar motor protein [Gammaproteobacteria bacterium]|nr:flagellar motor protein [Gammaproteobacteria bacterium]
MDALSIVGVVLAFLAILGGQYWEGGNLSALVNGPALLIVMGGTLGAILLQTPLNTFLRAARLLFWVFRAPRFDMDVGISQVLQWSMIARKEGLLGLENIEDRVKDPFSRKGLSLLVDGGEPENIRSIMMLELEMQEQYLQQGAKVYEAMGGYSPTIGIIGAVMGLIHVMGNLSDPSRLGDGIATAFVATIYGVGMANLFFLPIAGKLKNTILLQSHYREMMVEGIISVAEGENPRIIENKLNGFKHQDADLRIKLGRT